jgi:hypothetical protein
MHEEATIPTFLTLNIYIGIFLPKVLSWDPVISTGMRERMATIRMRMRKKKYRKPMMDQRRMRRTEGIVIEILNVRLYISDK